MNEKMVKGIKKVKLIVFHPYISLQLYTTMNHRNILIRMENPIKMRILDIILIITIQIHMIKEKRKNGEEHKEGNFICLN